MESPKKQDLSKRERQILDALYRLERASAAEIRDAIEDPPTYTAVRTHLTNLEEKGYVTFETDGLRYIYQPVVPRDEMAGSAMDELLRTFFQDRVELAVATLLGRREANITQAELDRLAEIIEQARKEGR